MGIGELIMGDGEGAVRESERGMGRAMGGIFPELIVGDREGSMVSSAMRANPDDDLMREDYMQDWYGRRQAADWRRGRRRRRTPARRRRGRRYPYDPRWDNGDAEDDEDIAEEFPFNDNLAATSEDTVHPNFEEGDYISDQILEEIGMAELLLVLEREVFTPNSEGSSSNTERARRQQAVFQALSHASASTPVFSESSSGGENEGPGEAEEGEIDEVRETAERRRRGEVKDAGRSRNWSFGKIDGDSEHSER